MKDDRLAQHAIIAGDVVVVDRDQPLKSGRLALVSIGGAPRLVRIRREGARFTFDGLPNEDTSVVVLGIASRVVRPLLP